MSSVQGLLHPSESQNATAAATKVQQQQQHQRQQSEMSCSSMPPDGVDDSRQARRAVALLSLVLTILDCMNDNYESTLRHAYTNPDDELFGNQGLQLVLAKVLADMNTRRCFAVNALYVDVDAQIKHTNGRSRSWLRDIPELAAHTCLTQDGGV
ncbi:hypothetical protein KCU95_g6508, partial [Aureobasidium melanogenum]